MSKKVLEKQLEKLLKLEQKLSKKVKEEVQPLPDLPKTPFVKPPFIVPNLRRPRTKYIHDNKCLLQLREDDYGQPVYCNTELKTKDELQNHMKNHYKCKQWYCQFCQKTYGDFDRYHRHLISKTHLCLKKRLVQVKGQPTENED